MKRVASVLGYAFLALGCLLLLFIPYALWGTGILTAHSQAVLHREFVNELHRTDRSVPPAVLHPKTTTATSPPTVAPPMADPAIGAPAGLLSIPAIGLSMTLVEGVGTAQLRDGPGHYPDTPMPGEAGNVGIAGHRTTYLHPFYNLNELRPGDPIVITTVQGTFTYRVVDTVVVSPDDVSVVDPTPTPQLTLTTCDPRFSASHRMVVKATLAASSLAVPASSTRSAASTGPSRPSGSGTKAPSRARPATTALAGRSGDWAPGILWGAGMVAVAVLFWTVGRRRRGWQRWATLSVGTVAVLAVMFFFFGAIAPLLPASF